MTKIRKSALEMTARRRRAKNFGPNLMTREGGWGGYAATQKKLGRCFRFEKKLVPYGCIALQEVLPAYEISFMAARCGIVNLLKNLLKES